MSVEKRLWLKADSIHLKRLKQLKDFKILLRIERVFKEENCINYSKIQEFNRLEFQQLCDVFDNYLERQLAFDKRFFITGSRRSLSVIISLNKFCSSVNRRLVYFQFEEIFQV